MTFQDSSTAFTSRSKEVAFGIKDILFTATDEKGQITETSRSFQKACGFTEAELYNSPHSLVRHPDMPKCIFHMLWERLEQGDIASAYLMNRAKDGSVYWTLTVFLPIEGGFYSIHVKPMSQVFDAVRELYRDLIEFERAGGSIEEGITQWQEGLHKAGFSTLFAFNAITVVKEVISRQTAIGNKMGSKELRVLQDMLETVHDLDLAHIELMSSFEVVQGIPSNMRIVASRLEPAGGPVSAISQNYRLMSDEVTNQLNGFLTQDKSQSLPSVIFTLVKKVLLHKGVVALHNDLIQAEGVGKPDDSVMGKVSLIDESQRLSKEGLSDIRHRSERVARCAKDIRQLVTGLDSIRVLCRVEAGRLGAESAALVPVIDQLDKSHKKIDQVLDGMYSLAEKVGDMTESLIHR